MRTHLIQVRAATLEDSEALASLSAALGYPSTEDAIRERVRRIRHSSVDQLLVAQDEHGAVLGWIQGHTSCLVESGARVEIAGLVVSAGARRRGVGRRLVEAVESWARAVAAESIVVRSNVTRTDSHRFYASLGYSETKKQAVYRKLIA